MEEEGGEITLEEWEEVLLEVDTIAILEILVEEVKTQVPVSQIVRELTNRRFNAIAVNSMEIMHLSAERDNIIRKTKSRLVNQSK
jgi:hypothetical protein